MATECRQDSLDFGTAEGRAVVGAFDGGVISSDAGALLLGATDRAIGLVRRFAGCFSDGREADCIEHTVATLVGQRLFAIALGYEDLNDHDELRHDPIMAVLAGKLKARRKRCAPVAGKSTLSRLEHAPQEGAAFAPPRYHKISHDGGAIADLFVTLFLEAHVRAPQRIILDLDATDNPLHGHQEGRFFHAYYDCYCYLPLYIFCGRHLLAAKLRRSNIDASAGSREEVARIVAQIRSRWPKVKIWLRADSGFAREELMAWCEENRVEYVFGLARNERLVAKIAPELKLAEKEAAKTGRPARRFKEFETASMRSSRRRQSPARSSTMCTMRGVACLSCLAHAAARHARRGSPGGWRCHARAERRGSD
jgi:Transposase DDE domain group 1